MSRTIEPFGQFDFRGACSPQCPMVSYITYRIVPQWSPDEEISCVVTIFGWTAIGPPTLIILIALSIRDAEISPFDDVSTRCGSSQIFLGHPVNHNSCCIRQLRQDTWAGMNVALSVVRMQRKEVRNMKIATSILAAVLLTGTLGSINTAMSADGVISKDEMTANSYCHEKFHSMTGQSLDTAKPVVNNSGATIDFYGSCSESPVGQDQIHDQKLEAQHRFANDYED